MKNFWIFALCAVAGFAGRNGWATEIGDEKDIEVESATAEMDGSQQTAGYINEKAEQEKIDNELEQSKADRQVKDDNWRRIVAERQIGKAETEIKQLKAEEAAAKQRQQLAHAARIVATKKLSAMVRQIKAYRKQLSQIEEKAASEEQASKAMQVKLVKAKRIRDGERMLVVKKTKSSDLKTARTQ